MFSEKDANKLLDVKVDLTSIEKAVPSTDTYMLSELTTANELFKSRGLVRIKDLNALSALVPAKLEQRDKAFWEEFLRLYSVLKLKK